MNLINQEKKIFSQNIIHSHPFVSICNTAANTLWWPNRIILHSLKDFLFLWNYKLWQSRVLSCWVESRHASHVWRCLPDVVQCTLQIFTDKRLKDLNCSSIQRRRALYNIETQILSNIAYVSGESRTRMLLNSALSNLQIPKKYSSINWRWCRI